MAAGSAAAGTLPLADRPIHEVVPLLERREVSSRDLVEACLARIERDGERLNTFLAVGAERALAAADVADGARADGVQAPLLGIPYALKDIFVTRALDDEGQPDGGLPTTAGSRILEGYLVAYASRSRRTGSRPPARSCSARPTATSSRWAARTRTAPTARSTTRGARRLVPGGSQRGIERGGGRRAGLLRHRHRYRRLASASPPL